MARIDAPLLDHLGINFEYFQVEPKLPLMPDTQQLLRFISRTPKLQEWNPSWNFRSIFCGQYKYPV
jgi:hypothetical protein